MYVEEWLGDAITREGQRDERFLERRVARIERVHA